MLRLGLLLALVLPCLAAERVNPLAGDAKAAETGRGTFRIYCAPCHGIRAQGGRGPDLSRGTFAAGESDADLFRVISGGVAGTEMGAYGHMGEDAVWRLVTYIRSVSKPDPAAVSGDRTRGETYFWGKGNCGGCHAVGARGSRLGPDLTRVGRQRSLAYLKTSIVDPSDDIVPGYAALVVVTGEGKKVRGVERGLDNFSGQMMDMSGKFYSFDRAAVKSMRRDTQSLMPAYATLSEPELSDLLAYLLSLRGLEVRP